MEKLKNEGYIEPKEKRKKGKKKRIRNRYDLMTPTVVALLVSEKEKKLGKKLGKKKWKYAQPRVCIHRHRV